MNGSTLSKVRFGEALRPSSEWSLFDAAIKDLHEAAEEFAEASGGADGDAAEDALHRAAYRFVAAGVLVSSVPGAPRGRTVRAAAAKSPRLR